MIKVKAVFGLLFVIVLLFAVATSCKKDEERSSNKVKSATGASCSTGGSEVDGVTLVGSETLPREEVEVKPYTYMDSIVERFDNDLDHKGYSIYLEFGARSTLIIENFNRMILEDQLGISSEEYSIVIEENILRALRLNEAYGGIGYGQEWNCKIPVAVMDVESGEVSDTYNLPFILYKSTAADSVLDKK